MTIDPVVEQINYLLGQRRALGFIGGRCSAVQAEIMRRIRDDKLYLPYASTWRAFCLPALGISRRHADRLIALLEEFGPVYFELNQQAGITPEEFRLIHGAVRQDGIEFDGNVIALKPGNHDQLCEAIGQLVTRARQSRQPDLDPAIVTRRLRGVIRRIQDLPPQIERVLKAPELRSSQRETLLAEIRTLQQALDAWT